MYSSLANSAGLAGTANTSCIQITTAAEPGERVADTLPGEPNVAPAGYLMSAAVNDILWPREAVLEGDAIHSASREGQLMAQSDTGQVGMVVEMVVDDTTKEYRRMRICVRRPLIPLTTSNCSHFIHGGGLL